MAMNHNNLNDASNYDFVSLESWIRVRHSEEEMREVFVERFNSNFKDEYWLMTKEKELLLIDGSSFLLLNKTVNSKLNPKIFRRFRIRISQ